MLRLGAAALPIAGNTPGRRSKKDEGQNRPGAVTTEAKIDDSPRRELIRRFRERLARTHKMLRRYPVAGQDCGR